MTRPPPIPAPTGTPSSEAEVPLEEAAYIDAALNTKGFPEFLAEFPDGDSVVNDKEEIEKRFRAFEKKGELGKDLRAIYREQIEKDTGLKLNDAELKAVEDLLGKEAVRDPERVVEVAEMAADFKHNTEAILQLEAEIQGYGGDTAIAQKLAELKEGKWSLMGARTSSAGPEQFPLLKLASWGEKISAFFKRSDETGVASTIMEQRAKAKDQFNISNRFGIISQEKLNAELQKIEDEIKYIEDVAQAKSDAFKEFGRLRTELTEGFLPVAEVVAVAKAKVQERLNAMGNDVGKVFSFEKADAAQDYLNKIVKVAETGGQDYLEGEDVAAFRDQLNKKIELKSVEMLTEAINKVVIASGSLTSLERAIEKFKTRERIGSREGDDVKNFLQEALTVISTDPKMSQAKKILISRLIAKLNP